MRKIDSMQIIEIDITNACNKSCSNCTRFCGHYAFNKIYFMDLDYFTMAVQSLEEFPGTVGIMGGEPTLHPKFVEICEIFRRYRPDKSKRMLLSNKGGNFEKYIEIIRETFGAFVLNDHISDSIKHTPILVASEETVQDQVDREKLIDNCWVQNIWSATINPKGAYFCEVAGMLSYLFDGPSGWNISKDKYWWKKEISEYKEQKDWACNKCGCAMPLIPRISNEGTDDVSKGNLERLIQIGSPKVKRNKYEIYNKGIDRSQVRSNDWYRGW